MRLRVTFHGQNDDDIMQIVLPVEILSETTIREIQFQIEQSLADVGIDDGLGELRLGGGFVLRGSDIASQVLRDNDEILAVSLKAWLAKELPLCTTTLYNLSKVDLARNKSVFVEIGLTSRNRLFLICGQGRGGRGGRASVERFKIVDDDSQLFSTSSLSSQLIFAQSDESNLSVTNLTEPGFVMLSNKPSHAVEATEVKLELERRDGKLVIKNETLFNPDAIDLKYLSATPALPTDKKSGPILSMDKEEDKENKKPIIFDIKTTNNWSIENWQFSLVPLEDGVPQIEIYTNIFRQSGGQDALSQFVAVNLQVINRLENSKIQIEDTIATLCGKDVLVYQAQRVACCGYNTQNQRDFAIDPRSREKISFVVRLDIPIDTNTHVWTPFRRLHRSLLTSPPVLELTFRTFDGDSCTLNISLPQGEPIEHPTKAHALKALSQQETDLLAFVHCDDTDTQSRLIWACALANDRHGSFLKCTRSPYRSGESSGGSIYIRPDALAKLAYDATQAQQTEIPVDALAYQDKAQSAGSCKVQVIALVYERRVYAFQVTLTTNTGSTSHAFRLPPIN